MTAVQLVVLKEPSSGILEIRPAIARNSLITAMTLRIAAERNKRGAPRAQVKRRDRIGEYFVKFSRSVVVMDGKSLLRSDESTNDQRADGNN